MKPDSLNFRVFALGQPLYHIAIDWVPPIRRWWCPRYSCFGYGVFVDFGVDKTAAARGDNGADSKIETAVESIPVPTLLMAANLI